MSPEPLKGKWIRKDKHHLYMRYGKNMELEKLVSQDCIELFDDVRIAVEWLKSIFDMSKHGREYIHQRIDEAFEDVMKDD